MKIKLLIIFTLLLGVVSYTYCAFTKSVEKEGTIQTKELSTVFLDNNAFLLKVQALDSSITSIDKTSLVRETSIPTIQLTNNNIVSTTGSSVPTYLWINNGVIYYYTIATSIDINNN